jgi:sugar/nucleoside kinase (ribokinase family)
MVVEGGERSMVTMFGASEMHSVDHLAEPNVARQLASARVIVLEAFYLLFNPELVLKVARDAVIAGKHVVINLSSTFVITTKTQLLKELFAYCDVIIGNKGEVEKLGQVFWPDLSDNSDVKDFGMRLLLDPVPKHHAHHRIVIITQGKSTFLNHLGM